ncbi:MAG: helix-turn-helix domain-containing protein [Elusimicrobiota bacterium]
MDWNVLREIGLTEGEIRVYKALAILGKSSSGGIMKKSGISSSKIYLILEKLIQKGLVSFILENNVKKFQVTNPKSVLDYIDNKKTDLEKTKKDFEEIIPQINSVIGKHDNEYAQVYRGFRGIKTVFNNSLEEMESGEEYGFFGVSNEEMNNKRVLNFFQNHHRKRVLKKVRVKGIVDNSLREFYEKRDVLGKFSAIRFHNLTMPIGMTIGKNRIIMVIWGDEDIAYEIVSKRIVERYKAFFDDMWKKARK